LEVTDEPGKAEDAKPISSLVLREMAPQENGELVAGLRATRAKSQIGQQCLSVPRPQTEDRARGEPSLETAEQGQSEPPHDFPARQSIA
jgi:hypothetical protein